MASVVNCLYFVVIGDRHVGIYASPDNWRTCFFVCLLSPHADRHVGDISVTVFLFFCLSAGFLVTDNTFDSR